MAERITVLFGTTRDLARCATGFSFTPQELTQQPRQAPPHAPAVLLALAKIHRNSHLTTVFVGLATQVCLKYDETFFSDDPLLDDCC